MKKIFALAAIPAMIFAAGTASADAWVSRNHSYIADDAVRVGNVKEDTQIDIVIGLKLRNKGELDNYVKQITTEGSPMFGQSLSHEFVHNNYEPMDADVEAVKSHLRNYGFTNIESLGQLVTAKATIAQAREAFQTDFAQFELNGKSFYANTRDARVPVALDGIVENIGGLNNHAFFHTMMARADGVTPDAGGFTPTQFPKAYGAVSTTSTGKSTDIGIITEGTMTQVLKDFSTFESANGIASIPVTVKGSGGTDNSGLDEWDLDSQDIAGMSGGVKSLTLFDATALTDAGLTAAYNLVIAATNVKAINVSLGGCELSEKTSGGMATQDAIFEKAVAQGQTFFVASGDSGSAECRRKTGQSYPAVSPYVTSVGGTTLSVTSSGTYSSETVWSGGGGGPSTDETEPSWQKPVTAITGGKRGVADWAFDANPSSGAKIYVNGKLSSLIGGTSLATPLATGTWSRAESASGNTLGFAAPLFYTLAEGSKYSTTFHDVKSGSNGGYSAKAGWDYPTGWGSANIDAFVTAIK